MKVTADMISYDSTLQCYVFYFNDRGDSIALGNKDLDDAIVEAQSLVDEGLLNG